MTVTYGAVTRCGGPFQILQLAKPFVTSRDPCRSLRRCRTTPEGIGLQATEPVWFGHLPLSLATTDGISDDFSSSGYLDVSVPPVPSRVPMYSVRGTGA